MDSLADAKVRTAAAEIAGHRCVNVGVGRIGLLGEERGGRHDLAGLAIAALGHTDFGPGALDGMGLVRGSKAFDCGDALADGGGDGRDAGTNWLTVDVDGACAALGDAAAVFGASETKLLSQSPKQWNSRLHIQRPECAVHHQLDWHGTDQNARYAPTCREAGRMPDTRPNMRTWAEIKGDAMNVILAGFIAGTIATLAQVLLWILIGENAWLLLLRDAQLTAALVLGTRVLAPVVEFNSGVLLVATGVHFLLSVTYAALLLPMARRSAVVPTLFIGAGFGAMLYLLNLYGLTVVFAWFAEARGGITLTVHCVFGMAVMLTLRLLSMRTGGEPTC